MCVCVCVRMSGDAVLVLYFDISACNFINPRGILRVQMMETKWGNAMARASQ